MTVCVHLLITGRVQGVGFRYTCQAMAEQFGVNGWVRNRWDGAVEVLAEGEAEAINRFTDWCRRGPPGAWVNRCDLTDRPPSGEYSSFEIVF